MGSYVSTLLIALPSAVALFRYLGLRKAVLSLLALSIFGYAIEGIGVTTGFPMALSTTATPWGPGSPDSFLTSCPSPTRHSSSGPWQPPGGPACLSSTYSTLPYSSSGWMPSSTLAQPPWASGCGPKAASISACHSVTTPAGCSPEPSPLPCFSLPEGGPKHPDPPCSIARPSPPPSGQGWPSFPAWSPQPCSEPHSSHTFSDAARIFMW